MPVLSAALPLLLAAQLLAPARPAPLRVAQAAAEPSAPAGDAGAPPAAPPAGEPAPAAPPAAEPAPTAPPSAESAPPAPAPATPAAAPERARFPSLLGAEPLRGASAVLAWAGWSSLGAAWAMGVSQEDDLGAYVDHDWSKSELHLGGVYRRPISSSGGWDLAGRLSAAWYTNFGSTLVYSENHSDHGLELAPALVLSTRAGGGLLAASAEGTMTVTWKYKAGFLFSPKVAVSYEAPLYPQVTLGARVGAGYRAGAGDAPLRTGRGELQFLVVAGYQLL